MTPRWEYPPPPPRFCLQSPEPEEPYPTTGRSGPSKAIGIILERALPTGARPESVTNPTEVDCRRRGKAPTARPVAKPTPALHRICSRRPTTAS
jgi:hypothetical protein